MKILPYPDKPIFQCYHDKAFQVGIIQANSPIDIKKWVCTKYVNCAFAPQSPMNKFIIMVSDDWGETEKLVNHQRFVVSKKSLDIMNLDLLHSLKSAIKNNAYIYGNYNEKYIPNKRAYKREDFMHDFLLIGCDRDMFLSAGYVANGRFAKFEIPNQNMIDGLLSLWGDDINLNMYSYESESVPTPNTKMMLDDLRKYISAIDQLNFLSPTEESRGIVTNIRLKEFFIDEVRRGKIYIDRRYARVLYEHKWVLAQLVDQFIDNTEKKKKHQEWANSNMEKAYRVHLLGLKLSNSRNKSIINSIASLMDQITESELYHIPRLIEDLEDLF